MKHSFLVIFIILISIQSFTKEKIALPFTFLNQYFDYSIDSQSKIKISSKSILWNSELIILKENRLLIQSNDFFKNVNWNVYFKNEKSKIIFSLKNVSIDKNFMSDVLPESALKETESICLISSNRYTQALVCKSVKANSAVTSYPQVMINGKTSSLTGRIILTQPKEKITLDIKASAKDLIRITTQKRLFVPSEIERDSSKQIYEIKFYDLEDKLFSWSDDIGYEQESFDIQNDKILNVKQDFFNKDYTKKDIKISYYKPPIPRKNINNMYAVYPYLGFANVVGNTTNQNVNLQSSIGFGFRGYLNYEFDKKNQYLKYLSLFDFMSFTVNFKKLDYISNVNNYSINNDGSFLYQLSSGLSIVYNEDLYYGVSLNINKDHSLEKVSSASKIGIGSLLNFDLGGYAHYLIFERGHLQSNVMSGLGFILPSQYSGESTQMGTRFYTKFDVGYREINTIYTLGFNYSYRQQETSAQKIKDQTFDYTFGYSVFF